MDQPKSFLEILARGDTWGSMEQWWRMDLTTETLGGLWRRICGVVGGAVISEKMESCGGVGSENRLKKIERGLVKIFKKYDKLSGALIRLPFIQKGLQEPFFKTNVLNQLVKECEMVHNRLFSMNERSTPSASSNGTEGCETRTVTKNRGRLNKLKIPKELAEIENLESSYVKLILLVLRVLKEIRSGSSTISVISLPPCTVMSCRKFGRKCLP
ncbi:hypothetical protein RJ639_041893 [Escallonia herrerae]|uniref:Uncharacterized protein n=1 Tax=Escallonia herrerae TaxID=1293975 RepID=A0AA89BBP6_9ASTE|nr:hypothetical protein RJ639_041893 [Escallonia herrerae]